MTLQVLDFAAAHARQLRDFNRDLAAHLSGDVVILRGEADFRREALLDRQHLNERRLFAPCGPTSTGTMSALMPAGEVARPHIAEKMYFATTCVY